MASSPEQIAATVTIENRRDTAATLTFPLACLGLLRVYDDPRSVPVWSQGPGEACPREPIMLTLEPGQKRRTRIPGVRAAEVLGGNHPEGEYRFTVLLAPDGHVLEIEAGEAQLAR